MKKTSLTLLAAFAAAFAILAPAALMAGQSNPPDPWEPPVKDTTGQYEYKLVDGYWHYTFTCPVAGGNIKCFLARPEPLPCPDPDLGWFFTDDNYYYFHAKEVDGTIVNDGDGTILMAVPKRYLDE